MKLRTGLKNFNGLFAHVWFIINSDGQQLPFFHFNNKSYSLTLSQ